MISERWAASTVRERQDWWPEYLESGEVEQDQGGLRIMGGGFCCLGAACHMRDPDAWRAIYDQPLKSASDGDFLRYGGESSYLPEFMTEEMGLRRYTGAFDHRSLDHDLLARIASEAGKTMAALLEEWANETPTLAGLNDDGVGFSTIAAVIRARPKGLFIEEEK